MSTILLGVDSSARSEDAVALALRFARASSADVIVASITPADDVARADAAVAAARMRDLLSSLPGDRVRVRVVTADSAARGLHELAEQEAATVIVVGSTHTGHIGRVRPGSTGERLLSGSPCAVALAPHGYRLEAGKPIARVGTAYDGSPEARGALVAADATARAFAAPLEVVSVVPIELHGASGLMSEDSFELVHSGVETEIRRDLDEVVSALPGAEGIVLHGRPVHELVEHSGRLDLLFAGSRGYGPAHAVIAGGTSGPLMQHAHCPVVVLPRGADTAFADLFEDVNASTAAS